MNRLEAEVKALMLKTPKYISHWTQFVAEQVLPRHTLVVDLRMLTTLSAEAAFVLEARAWKPFLLQ